MKIRSFLLAVLLVLGVCSVRARADVLSNGQVIQLFNMGNQPGASYLGGSASSGQVSLADSDQPGTRWRVRWLARDIVALQCLVGVSSPRWLSGSTVTGKVELTDRPTDEPGTRWKVHREGDSVILECLQPVNSVRFLNVTGTDGTVELTSQLDGVSSARWKVVPSK